MSTVTASSIVYNIPEVNSGTTTSWIPVTTAWPSSSGCESAFYSFPGQPAPVAWDPGYGYFAGGTLRCLPPAATTWHEQDHQGGDGFTSVSIMPVVCPAAFTTAATSIQSGSSTLVLCCPSGYALQNGEPGRAVGTCKSPLTSGQIITYLVDSGASATLAINSSTTMNAVQFEGWNIATTTSEILSNSTSSSSLTSTSQCSSSLSSGAKAGIGVSAAIGGIGLLALIGAFFLLRRRPKVAQYDAVPPVQAGPSQLDAQEKPVELPDR